ncbi:MAG: phosphoribosylanthranilate isomerase [Clostridia bacterium]|nr:phosphoribosylanthranilate isomerase [Clostridia bacterium]
MIVKICGLRREEDMAAVNAAKPEYAGFILSPRFKRFVAPETVAAYKDVLLPQIRTVGVFVDESPEYVTSAASQARLDVIQLHGHEDNAYVEKVREASGCEIWRAFTIRSQEDVAAAEASLADKVILDGGTGEGKRFNWDLIAGIRRPYILAGGLSDDNVAQARDALHPYGVDVSSGVETDGVKDPEKILRFAREARGIPDAGD